MSDKNGYGNSPQRPDGEDFDGVDNDATQVFNRPSSADDATSPRSQDSPKPPEYHRAEEFQPPRQDPYTGGGYGQGQPNQGAYGAGYNQGASGGHGGYHQGNYGGGYNQGGYGHNGPVGPGGPGYGPGPGGYNQGNFGGGYNQGGYGQGGYGQRGPGGYNQAGPGGYNQGRYGDPQQSRKSSGKGVLMVVLPIVLLLAIGFGVFMLINSNDSESSDNSSSSSSSSETSETSSSETSTTPSLPSFPTDPSDIPSITGPEVSELFPSDWQQELDGLMSQLNEGIEAPAEPTGIQR